MAMAASFVLEAFEQSVVKDCVKSTLNVKCDMAASASWITQDAWSTADRPGTSRIIEGEPLGDLSSATPFSCQLNV